MIDTEALRKQVLELSISGKLVEQLAEEGDATELIEANKRKKEKLVELGTLKKEKTQKDIKLDGKTVEMARVIFYALACTYLAQHFQVIPRTLFYTLSLKKLALTLEPRYAFLKLCLYRLARKLCFFP